MEWIDVAAEKDRRVNNNNNNTSYLAKDRPAILYLGWSTPHGIELHVWVVRSRIVEMRPSGRSPCPNKCLKTHEKKLRIQIALLFRNWKHCRGALFIFMGQRWNGPKLTSRAIWHRHITPIKTRRARADKSNVKGRDFLSLSWLMYWCWPCCCSLEGVQRVAVS